MREGEVDLIGGGTEVPELLDAVFAGGTGDFVGYGDLTIFKVQLAAVGEAAVLAGCVDGATVRGRSE